MKHKLLNSMMLLALIFTACPLQAAEGKTYKRIISLYAAHTEVLLRLGARDSLVGISAQESYQGPETEGWQRPQVFSIRDDAEKYLAAKPDLVLVRPMHMAAGSHLVTALENAGIKVYPAQVVQSAGLYEYWRNLAELVGKKDEAEKMIADFNARISVYYEAASLKPENEKPGVFIEAIHGPVKTFTPESIPVWLVELAGGRNVAADAVAQAPGLMIANYGPERLLSKANEVEVFISQTGAMNASTIEQVKGRSIYQPLAAHKHDRVYTIPEEILARPTPSLLIGLARISELTGIQAEISPPASVEPFDEIVSVPNEDGELRVELPPDQKTE